MNPAARGSRISPCLLRRSSLSRPAVLLPLGYLYRTVRMRTTWSAAEKRRYDRFREEQRQAQVDSQIQAAPAKRKRRKWTWGHLTTTLAELSVKKPSLPSRPGIAKLLGLRELTDPPGMEFDLKSLSLSVHEEFPSRLRDVCDSPQHQVKPWLTKALIQRAKAWELLDLYDLRRVSRPQRIMNKTNKRHFGATMGHPTTLSSLCAAAQKSQNNIVLKTWPHELGPVLPPWKLGHLDGMLRGDVRVYTETYRRFPQPPDPHPSLSYTTIWVAINAPLRTALRNWESLASGSAPHPDEDTLAPILQNFGQWLKGPYRACQPWRDVTSKPDNSSPGMPPAQGGSHDTQDDDLATKPHRATAPLRNDSDAVPVVFAWHQKYIWFLWTGGFDGKLIAQYASHWLPLEEGNRAVDLDKEIWKVQQGKRNQLKEHDSSSSASSPPVGSTKLAVNV